MLKYKCIFLLFLILHSCKKEEDKPKISVPFVQLENHSCYDESVELRFEDLFVNFEVNDLKIDFDKVNMNFSYFLMIYKNDTLNLKAQLIKSNSFNKSPFLITARLNDFKQDISFPKSHESLVKEIIKARFVYRFDEKNDNIFNEDFGNDEVQIGFSDSLKVNFFYLDREISYTNFDNELQKKIIINNIYDCDSFR